jgi:hypothetical protein
VEFLFQTYSKHLNAAQKESSRRFAADVIKFVNGEAPWTAFDEKSPSVRVYGPSETENRAVVLEVEGNESELKKKRKGIFSSLLLSRGWMLYLTRSDYFLRAAEMRTHMLAREGSLEFYIWSLETNKWCLRRSAC